MWKDVGYVSLTKDGRGLNVVLKHQRYYVKLEEAKFVLDGKVKYTLIYEPETVKTEVKQ